MQTRYRWLSPPGASALALLFLHEPVSPDLFSGTLTVLDGSPRRLWLRGRDGDIIDEAMGSREPGGILLTLHGGPGVRSAVEAELGPPGQTDDSSFGDTPFARATLGLLPHARGAAAARLLLEASTQAKTLAQALDGADLQDLLSDSSAASFLIDTPRVQIWGPVNAGKSSLLNALSGRALATVGDEPGLTRDIIEGRVQHEGFELRLFDAPGTGAATSLDEQAITLARRWQAQADLTIELVPPGATPPPQGWWYHSRADESGLPGLSVHHAETLTELKDRLVEHFFGPLRRLPAHRRFALHPGLRADLQALVDGDTNAATLRDKWLA